MISSFRKDSIHSVVVYEDVVEYPCGVVGTCEIDTVSRVIIDMAIVDDHIVGGVCYDTVAAVVVELAIVDSEVCVGFAGTVSHSKA